ncbi:MAG: CHRD domain-containing protein [Planctomycetota bacterium]
MLRLSSFVLFAALSAANLTSQIQHFSARLTGDQETPPVATAASGFAIVSVDTTTSRVDVFAYGVGLTAVAAHLHSGAIGAAGPIVLPLTGGPQQWTGSLVLPAATIAAIQAGNTYVNLHTAANPGGEIRGQVLTESTTRFTALLDGSQETPPNGSAATGVMTVFLHEPSHVLVYEMNTSGVAATAAHIHVGAAGIAGPILVPLNGTSPRWCGVSSRLSDANVALLQSGGLYVNVHSAAFPGGEIRGQLRADVADFTASLDGSQETPPVVTAALGRACIELQPDGRVSYRVQATGLTATAAHFHNGLPGVAGPIVVPLAGGPTLWTGTSGVLTTTQIADLRAGRWYVNVHTAANPGGEIRGQILATNLPATFGRGCPVGTATTPEIGSLGNACVGTGFVITLSGAPIASPAVVLFGVSRDTLPSGARLPLTLAPIGAPDCFLFHDNPGISLSALTDALGCARTTLPIPFLPAAPRLYAQWFVIAPGANPLGLASSNALDFQVH